jgi:hypothetical protein
MHNEETEFRKDIEAPETRNLKPVNITLTAIEIFAIVGTINGIPEFGSYHECAKEAAKKMHNCLDPNSLLVRHLNEILVSEKSDNFRGENFPAEDFPPEGFGSESFSF